MCYAGEPRRRAHAQNALNNIRTNMQRLTDAHCTRTRRTHAITQAARPANEPKVLGLGFEEKKDAQEW